MEMGNYGDVAKYAATLNINVSKAIPNGYIQLVYDFFIQVSIITKYQLSAFIGLDRYRPIICA